MTREHQDLGEGLLTAGTSDSFRAVLSPGARLPIPLLPPDPELPVSLGPLFASVYDGAKYSRSIDYRAPLALPLAPADRGWAEELARASVR